jgi:phosphohistidine phosphatase
MLSVYAASAAELLNRIRRIPDRTASATIIGHNPGLQDLAATLVGYGPWLQRLWQSCAVPSRAGANWAPGDAKLIDFVVPRQL